MENLFLVIGLDLESYLRELEMKQNTSKIDNNNDNENSNVVADKKDTNNFSVGSKHGLNEREFLNQLFCSCNNYNFSRLLFDYVLECCDKEDTEDFEFFDKLLNLNMLKERKKQIMDEQARTQKLSEDLGIDHDFIISRFFFFLIFFLFFKLLLKCVC